MSEQEPVFFKNRFHVFFGMVFPTVIQSLGILHVLQVTGGFAAMFYLPGKVGDFSTMKDMIDIYSDVKCVFQVHGWRSGD